MSDCDDYEFMSCSSSVGNCSSDSFSSIPTLFDTLESIFCDVPKNFNVVHINAQSIPAHFIQMLASFKLKTIHAILVSESWLKPCLSSSPYTIPGFQLIRNDRTGSGAGGVAIYIRNHIPFTVINMSAQPPPSSAGEHLFLQVSLSHRKILLGVYYSPSLRINYFSSFEKLLEELIPLHDHTIIMGDFNTCLNKHDSRSTSLENIAQANNLSILPLNVTHHFPNCQPSLLDLILVSSSIHVAKHGQCSADDFSYHDLLFLSYKIRPPKAKPKVLLQRNFGDMEVESLRNDARNADWSEVLNADTIDEKVDSFNSIMTKLYDVHAPVRAVKMKHLPAPWLTDQIRAEMHKKLVAKVRFKRNSSDENKEKYVERRNHCNRVCRDAQRRYIHDSVENNNPAKVWKFLRSLGVGKSRQDTPKVLDVNSLNLHFSTSSNFDGHTKTQTLNYLSSLPTPDFPPFLFSQFTDCDVKKSISSISSNAVGSDCISKRMISPILDDIVHVITNIFNFSINTGTFPSAWKEAQVTPLPKKPNPESFSEYRPISILPFLSKVLERLVHQQLSLFLNRNCILNPYQSGFRPGHSTVSALIKITDDIRHGMEDGLVTVLSLLDFSNAFNNVDSDILLALLRSLNISPTEIDWFHDYLYGRRQRIRIDDTFSTWCQLNAGVPQGGVLSPLLFAIFINSISEQISSSYHLYADDLQIYTQAPVGWLGEAITNINDDLQNILEWSKSYGLKVNPRKTQVIVIGSSRMISLIDWPELPQVIFDGTSIEISKVVKNLGVLLDRNLSWGPQLAAVSRKTFAAAASLKRLRNFLPTSTKIALAQSLLHPILDYADASYPDLTEDQLNKLERLQNFSIRFIFGLRKYDHISEYRNRLKWLPIRLRRNAHILSILYSILFVPSTPSYLKERFEFLHLSNPRYLRSTDTLHLKTPTHKSEFESNSFTLQAIRLWNALPVPIRHAKSLPIFKSMVKQHYLSSLYLPT